MDFIRSSGSPILDFKDEFLNYDPHRSHFESLGGHKIKSGDKQRAGLLKMFWISFGRFHPHTDDKGYFGCVDAFSCGWLLKNLVYKSATVRKIVSPYYSYTNWIKGKKAREWRFHNETEKSLLEVFSSNEPARIAWPENFGSPKPLYYPKDSSIELPSFLPINLGELDKLVHEWNGIVARSRQPNVLRKYGNHEDIIRNRNRLLILRKIAISMAKKGTVPNFYQRVKTSRRLYGVGYNLQWISKEARHRMLAGNGLYDYDFVACHPTIMLHLLQHLKVSTPVLEDFIGNRARKTEELEAFLNLPAEDVKKILTIIVLSSDFRSEFKEVFFICRRKKIRIEKLERCKWFTDLVNEYSAGRKALIKQFKKGSGIQSPTGDLMNVQKGEASNVSFILQSIEAELLELACGTFSDTKLLCFDGWISPKRDLTKLEVAIDRAP
jgi:hypothetical protein